MSEREWTPGPWGYRRMIENDHEHFAVGNEVAEIGVAIVGYTPLADALANARLIAASPEMADYIHEDTGLMIQAREALPPQFSGLKKALQEAIRANDALLQRIRGGDENG